MALALSGLSITGTTYMAMRFTASPTARSNGQVNLWDDNSGGPADQGAGTLDDGSAAITGLTGAGTLIRIGRWTSNNRFILNSNGTALGDHFTTGTSNRVSLFREASDGTIATFTVGERRAGGGSYVDWWQGQGLTSDEWTMLNSIADGDSVILAIHTGTATYTSPVTTTSSVYDGGAAPMNIYDGANPVAVYDGDELIWSRR